MIKRLLSALWPPRKASFCETTKTARELCHWVPSPNGGETLVAKGSAVRASYFPSAYGGWEAWTFGPLRTNLGQFGTASAARQAIERNVEPWANVS